MRSRFTLFSIVIFLALATIPCAAESDLIDLHELGFQVVSAKAVPQITLSPGDLFVRPKAGNQLVVVELKGTLKRPGRFAVAPAEFAVFYEVEKPAKPNWPAWKDVLVIGAEHVEGGNGQWVARYVTSAEKPGDVTVRFAVTLPEDVHRFTVLYGCFAKPTAQIAAAEAK
jgi:hypothetical protein